MLCNESYLCITYKFVTEGEISVMGKSIVILDRNLAHRKFSCANIEPDKDIIKYANIQKSPRFVL